MSKVAPHNSYIKLEDKDGKRVAVKYYQKNGKYSAKQEFQAYSELQDITSNVPGVRTVNVLLVGEKENTLTLEYIPGLTLQEKVKKGNVASLDLSMVTLISLFILARNHHVNFDSDPSNIMFDDAGIVLIDPVCTEILIEDYTFIVFMWGLIKIVLRNVKIWNTLKIISVWKKYLNKYCELTSTSNKSISRQLVKYIDLVITWNKKKNKVENWIVFIFRLLIVVPVYKSVRLYFVLVKNN